jgi:type I restriction enzyme S subunit
MPVHPQKISTAYFALLSEDRYVQQTFFHASVGVHVEKMVIDMAAWLRYRIHVPPVIEQQRVLCFVGALDGYLQKATALRDLKRRYKRALMQCLLMDGGPQVSASKGWRTYRLGELFVERIEKKREDLPLLAITSDRGVIPRSELGIEWTSTPDKATYLRIAPGDIGYNTMRMWQGVSARSSIDGVVSPAYTVCIPQTDKIDSEFASILFKHKSVIALFRRFSQGLVDDTLSLKFDQFAEIRVAIPILEEQKTIAAIFRSIDAELEVLDRLISSLARQRASVVAKLVTGELRFVRE